MLVTGCLILLPIRIIFFLTKFEKDHFKRDFSTTRGGTKSTSRSVLDYTFVQAFPLSLTAIPVSYEDSQVLKCSVSF